MTSNLKRNGIVATQYGNEVRRPRYQTLLFFDLSESEIFNRLVGMDLHGVRRRLPARFLGRVEQLFPEVKGISVFDPQNLKSRKHQSLSTPRAGS